MARNDLLLEHMNFRSVGHSTMQNEVIGEMGWVRVLSAKAIFCWVQGECLGANRVGESGCGLSLSERFKFRWHG